MAEFHHLRVTKRGDVYIVHFTESRITDELTIANIGQELYTLATQEDCTRLLLSFAEVDLFSTSMLGKLISLNKRMKQKAGKVSLCEIKPKVREIFTLTNLDRILDIRGSEMEGVAALSA